MGRVFELSNDDIARIHDMYDKYLKLSRKLEHTKKIASKYGTDAIAKKFGIGKLRVKYIVGISSTSKRLNKLKRFDDMSIFPEDVAKVVSMRMSGMTLGQIGKKLGFSKQYAHQLLNKALKIIDSK